MNSRAEGEVTKAASKAALELSPGYRPREPLPAGERSARLVIPKALSPNRLGNWLFIRGRRGTISAVFAVGMTSFFGMVGLGTEVGSWYLGKRHGQNAADGAAMAGALMLNALGATCSPSAPSSITTAATSEAANNGISSGVTVNCPPLSGNYKGNASAVEVIIAQSPTPVLAALFVSSVSIGNRAVAQVQANGRACILGINHANADGTDLISGSAYVDAPDCALVANGTDSQAIDVQDSGATVKAYSLISSGGCSGCTGSNVTLTRAYQAYQPPTPDPFAAIQQLALPTFSGANCASSPVPYETAGQAFCNGTLKVNNGSKIPVNLTPGTYFFYNSSLDMEGGTLECTTCTPGGAGVTLIFTGSSAANIGTIKITGNATVNLNAPYTNAYNSAFNGVLLYMDARALESSGCGNAPAIINGSVGSVFTGALYLPSVNICYSGNMTSGQTLATNCFAVVANDIHFTGNSGLSVDGCPQDGVPYPQTQGAVMTE